MNIADIEQAARLAWPALQEQESSTGLLRCARGVSRRANSMNPWLNVSVCPYTLRQETEDFFSGRSLPAIVKVLDDAASVQGNFCEIDQVLAAAGYRLQATTRVMVLGLEHADFANVESAAYVPVTIGDWLSAWYTLRDCSRSDFFTHQAMLERIEGKAACLLLSDQHGSTLATGMGVATDTAVGIFGVATHSRVLRQGYASALIMNLLAWGREQGARYAYLQVEADNESAGRLYGKLGFVDSYSYWYRVKPGPIKKRGEGG